MSAIELRLAALAKAHELKREIERVAACPEYGPGPRPALALDFLEDAIGYLTPTPPDDDEDGDDPGAPRWLAVSAGDRPS